MQLSFKVASDQPFQLSFAMPFEIQDLFHLILVTAIRKGSVLGNRSYDGRNDPLISENSKAAPAAAAHHSGGAREDARAAKEEGKQDDAQDDVGARRAAKPPVEHVVVDLRRNESSCRRRDTCRLSEIHWSNMMSATAC